MAGVYDTDSVCFRKVTPFSDQSHILSDTADGGAENDPFRTGLQDRMASRPPSSDPKPDWLYRYC
jgi:hypothetical protein